MKVWQKIAALNQMIGMRDTPKKAELFPTSAVPLRAFFA
jgi:hypothetical protein